jgi:nucleoside-diphosphate-sugar epimerase
MLSDVYAVTKIAGERIALAGHAGARVLRLSNVYGRNFDSGLFVADILRQAAQTGIARFLSSSASEKDYVNVADVAGAVLQLCTARPQFGVFNVGYGSNTSNVELEIKLQNSGISIEVATGAPTSRVAPIDTRRIRRSIEWSPRSILDDLPSLLDEFRENVRTARP